MKCKATNGMKTYHNQLDQVKIIKSGYYITEPTNDERTESYHATIPTLHLETWKKRVFILNFLYQLKEMYRRKKQKNIKIHKLIETQRICNVKAFVTPTITAATECLSWWIQNHLDYIPGKHSSMGLQKTALLGTVGTHLNDALDVAPH